jgi:hypothetical protein
LNVDQHKSINFKLKGESNMKLSAPKSITFVIALILALVGLFAALGILAFIPVAWGLWLLFVGFAVLALGVLLKGL